MQHPGPSEEELEKSKALRNAWNEYLIVRKLVVPDKIVLYHWTVNDESVLTDKEKNTVDVLVKFLLFFPCVLTFISLRLMYDLPVYMKFLLGFLVVITSYYICAIPFRIYYKILCTKYNN